MTSLTEKIEELRHRYMTAKEIRSALQAKGTKVSLATVRTLRKRLQRRQAVIAAEAQREEQLTRMESLLAYKVDTKSMESKQFAWKLGLSLSEKIRIVIGLAKQHGKDVSPEDVQEILRSYGETATINHIRVVKTRHWQGDKSRLWDLR